MELEAENLTNYMAKCASSGTPFDPTQLFPNYTLRIISSMAFGKALGQYESAEDSNASPAEASDENFDIAKSVLIIFDYLSGKHLKERIISPLRRMPWARWPVFLQTCKDLRNMLEKLVIESERKFVDGNSKFVFKI